MIRLILTDLFAGVYRLGDEVQAVLEGANWGGTKVEARVTAKQTRQSIQELVSSIEKMFVLTSGRRNLS